MIVLVSIFFVISALKWGDLKNWKLYYPTMMYFAIGDLVYNFLTYNNPLWQYANPILKHTASDLLVIIVVYPSTVLLFLSYYPDKLIKKIKHIAFWVFIFSALEWIFYTIGYFTYHNGWNIWWSVVHNLLAFPLLRLHYKKPILVWPISMALAFAILVLFDIPLSSLK